MFSYHHVKTRHGAEKHEVYKAHEVANEENYKHERIKEGSVRYIVAIVSIGVEHVVAEIQANYHGPIAKTKCSYIVPSLIPIEVPNNPNLDHLKGRPREVKSKEPHQPFSDGYATPFRKLLS